LISSGAYRWPVRDAFQQAMSTIKTATLALADPEAFE
jgi:hypothetical protein